MFRALPATKCIETDVFSMNINLQGCAGQGVTSTHFTAPAIDPGMNEFCSNNTSTLGQYSFNASLHDFIYLFTLLLQYLLIQLILEVVISSIKKLTCWAKNTFFFSSRDMRSTGL